MEIWEKSETVDPEVRAYVHSLVSAIGGQSNIDDRYAIGDDALAVLNDLLRWLRLYDEKTNRYDVKRCLAQANIVRGDLLEILALWPEEEQDSKLKAKLALACLQLLVPLTWPLEAVEERTTVNHLRHMPYLQLAQVGYKRAILQCEYANVLRTILRLGLPSIATPRRERGRRDEALLRMVLYFFRNVAMIAQPQHLPSQGDENDVGRSATVQEFHKQDVFAALLTIGSSIGDEFPEQDVIVLEILFHLLKGVDPRKLMMDNEQKHTAETDELQALMRREKAMLQSYVKHAPTRHNRFGTMIWVKRDDHKLSTVTGQNTITSDSTTLLAMDSSKKWDKPKLRGKTGPQLLKETGDFGVRVELTEEAHKHLQTFVEDFLDSSFNSLFATFRKALERGVDRVGEEQRMQYFYLISWFLRAEAVRRERAAGERAKMPEQTKTTENQFAHIAAVLDQETFVLLGRQMQRAFDEKYWQDLQAMLLCFTQILLTVQSMADSEDEEDQEIAENIQSRIFYEGSTHDLVVHCLGNYKNQGLAYLDALTDCAHVFVRMLERYSKQNVDMHIRSKRRARKKRKETNGQLTTNAGNQEADAEDAAEDEREAYIAVSERKFDFARFSAKFLTQPCVNTFISLLSLYADLNPAQLKRCHRYFYRLAFKHDLAIFLFRVDILHLLHKLIKGPGQLSSDFEIYKDWQILVQQVFRKCIKWLERTTEGQGWKEAAVVEMLFSKMPASLFYLQNGFEKVIEKKTPRPPAELEIKASIKESGRISVAVSLMIDQGKADAVSWVKKEIDRACKERQAWEDEQTARAAQTDGEAASEVGVKGSAPTIFMAADTNERKMSLFTDKFLRLLLTTLGCERLGTADDMEASWIVPSRVSADQLKGALEQIQKTEFDPPTFDDGKAAADLVRNKTASRRSAASTSDTESAGDDDIDGPLFPPNLREPRDGDLERSRPKKRRLTPRNQSDLSDEQLAERAEERKQRERERNAKIKSQLFITDSDDEDDAERDAKFFREEEERRSRMAGVIHSQLRKEKEGRGKKKRRSEEIGAGKAKKRKVLQSDDEDGSDRESENDALSNLDASSTDIDRPIELVDGSSETDEFSDSVGDETFGEVPKQAMDVDQPTPPTSGPDIPNQTHNTARPLAELSANVATAGLFADDEDEDEAPVTKRIVRRNVRAGFLMDDSDDSA